MTHWAAPLIGKPWSPAGEGPDSFNCWSLVRTALRLGWGIAVPPLVSLAEPDAIEQMKAKVGWHLATDEPRERDIVLMTAWFRKLAPHVGLIIRDERRLVLLHSDGFVSRRGPTGSVVAQPLRDALSGAYRLSETWRLPA